VSCKKDDDKTNPNAPVIDTMVPLSGPKGTLVTLTGKNFSDNINNVSAYVNGKLADVIAVSSTTIEFEVPPNAGDGPVTIAVNGDGASGPEFDFDYTITVSIFSGTSMLPGLVNGPASTAQFKTPRGMAIDNNNNIYVADEQNNCIRRVSSSGSVITFAGSGIAGYQDGIGTSAQFKHPYDIAFDSINQFFYVADKDNHCIRKISMSGNVVTVAGIPGTVGYVDAPGSSARFSSPTGVAVTNELERIFVADGGNHCIRKIDNLSVVTTVAGTQTSGNLDGSGASAQFSMPYEIAADQSGNLYVTDISNHNVRRMDQSGNVNTIAGAGFPGFADGNGTSAIFNRPCGIIEADGILLVCDAFNHKLRKIESNDEVTTLAGSTSGFSNGVGSQVKFYQPGGIVRDSYGIFYIADTGNNSIRKIIID